MPTHEDRAPYHHMTRAVEAVVDPYAGVQRSTFGEWLRVGSASTSVLLQFQRAGLEASVRVADAIGEANRQVLDAWLGTAQQTHRALRQAGELWSSQAERMLEVSEHASERTADRVTREAERVPEAAAAAARQHGLDMHHEQDRAEHAHEGAEHGRDRQHRDPERAREQREHEPRQRESAERPTIKIVKREDDWAVVRESASRASGVFETKREAVGRARELAKRDDAEVHVGRAADAGRTNGQRSGREQKPTRGAKGAKR